MHRRPILCTLQTTTGISLFHVESNICSEHTCVHKNIEDNKDNINFRQNAIGL